MAINIINTVNTVVVTPAIAEYLWEKFPDIPIVSFKDPLEIISDNRLFFSNDTIERADWLTIPILETLAKLKVSGELQFEYANNKIKMKWGYIFDGNGHYECMNKRPDFNILLNDIRYVSDKKELSLSSLYGTESDVINMIQSQVKQITKEYPGSKDINFGHDNSGTTPKVYINFARPENELERNIRIQHEQYETMRKLPASERYLKLIELSEQRSATQMNFETGVEKESYSFKEENPYRYSSDYYNR